MDKNINKNLTTSINAEMQSRCLVWDKVIILIYSQSNHNLKIIILEMIFFKPFQISVSFLFFIINLIYSKNTALCESPSEFDISYRFNPYKNVRLLVSFKISFKRCEHELSFLLYLKSTNH